MSAPHPLCEKALVLGLTLLSLTAAGCEGQVQPDGLPDDLGCSTCHGGAENAAPPLSLSGETDTAALGVGAHQAHLTDGAIRTAIACDTCHLVPAQIETLGHVDPLPAEVSYGGLGALAPGSGGWSRPTATCTNVYCHGVTLDGGANTTPVWTTVDGSQSQCDSCHGSPPTENHPAVDLCYLCHSGTVAPDQTILIAGGLHIDGKVDVDDVSACDACHGGGGDPSPPVDLVGNTDTTARGVGAHREHLAASTWHRTLVCTDCHLVPQNLDDPGHVDTALPAELTWGGLAVADGALPAFDDASLGCSGTYCHGATLALGPGSVPDPTWTVVDGSQDGCDACHGLAPGGTHPTVSPTDCGGCHPFTGLVPDDPATHIDGVVDLGVMSCDACHGGGGDPSPPTDLARNTDTTARGVGAHREHLAASTWHRTMVCTDCHLVPQNFDDPGHVDTALPAELTWGGLAVADGALPAFDGASLGCSGTYCHGATLALGPGSVPDPTWTVVDGSQDGCDACHGLAPGGAHPAVSPTDCGGCHPFTGLVPDDPATHIDGVVDLGSMACDACHGSGGEAAPPVDLSGNVDTTSPGVGAHREHLAISTWRRTIDCADCHLVPVAVGDPGHLDTGVPAEMTWGGVGVADGATPTFDRTTFECSGTYCHGTTLSLGPGAVPTPDWTVVDGSQGSCGDCHGVPPGGAHPIVSPTDCGGCHPWSGLAPIDPATHINGVIDGGACDSCHAYPPATGAHAVHVGDVDATPWATYGGLLHTIDVRAGATTYLFDCGQCHPLDMAQHMNGTVDVAIASGVAVAGTLRSLSDPAATYGLGGVCRGTYCHSTGQENPVFIDSPPWTGSFAGPRCAGCHQNPPAYPSGGAGTATANTHLQMGDDNWEFGHWAGLPGPWHTNDHGNGGLSASPMTCQTCHYDTVDPNAVGPGGLYYLDTTGNYDLGSGWGYTCVSCHTGVAGAPAQGVGGVQPPAHVNGVRDVVFEQRTSIPAGTAGIPTDADTPTYPTWVGQTPTAANTPVGTVVTGQTWSIDLTISIYDPATKSCQNVGCHMKQSYGTGDPAWDPLVWGVTPVGWATCNACHQY